MNYFILICILVLISDGVYCHQCHDCISYDRCPTAMDHLMLPVSAKSQNLLKNAGCGFSPRNRLGKQFPMVCCSMIPTKDETKTVESPEDIRIANHRNMKLLSEDCGHFNVDRIVGGERAAVYEFPWMALIAHKTRNGVGFSCGATIINKRYVLTAAHCVFNKSIVGVRVGEYDISSEFDCENDACESHIQDIQVNKSVIHDQYVSRKKGINDIALLRMNEDIDFNHKNVHRICLPTTSKLRGENLGNKTAIVTGWGSTEDSASSSVLRKVTVPIMPPDNCIATLSRYNHGDIEGTANQICAGVQTKDSCNGDSGGPLQILQLHNGRYKYIQYGVVSHGPERCGSHNPAAYVDVTKYMGWILDKISP